MKINVVVKLERKGVKSDVITTLIRWMYDVRRNKDDVNNNNTNNTPRFGVTTKDGLLSKAFRFSSVNNTFTE